MGTILWMTLLSAVDEHTYVSPVSRHRREMSIHTLLTTYSESVTTLLTEVRDITIWFGLSFIRTYVSFDGCAERCANSPMISS